MVDNDFQMVSIETYIRFLSKLSLEVGVQRMRRGLLSLVLGLILGTIAIFPMFVAAAGHDSTSIFVPIAHSVAINWPFSLADFILPASASRDVSSLGIAIHYGFYTLIAWLLLHFLRRNQQPAQSSR